VSHCSFLASLKTSGVVAGCATPSTFSGNGISAELLQEKKEIIEKNMAIDIINPEGESEVLVI